MTLSECYPDSPVFLDDLYLDIRFFHSMTLEDPFTPDFEGKTFLPNLPSMIWW